MRWRCHPEDALIAELGASPGHLLTVHFQGRITGPVLWNERAESAGPDYTPLVSDLTAELCPPTGGDAPCPAA